MQKDVLVTRISGSVRGSPKQTISTDITKQAHKYLEYLNEEDLVVGLSLEERGLLCLQLDPLQSERQLILAENSMHNMVSVAQPDYREESSSELCPALNNDHTVSYDAFTDWMLRPTNSGGKKYISGS